jgi:hypothetical protein
LRPALAAALDELEDRRRSLAGLAESMDRFAWPIVVPRYDAAVGRLAARHDPEPGTASR